MSDDTDHPHAIFITLDMRQRRIDLNVLGDAEGKIPVEELAASLRRAGVEYITCDLSEGKRAGQGFDEVLEFRAVLPD